MKVFLGGTCNDSTWREQLIPMLKIDYFNPVVPDWTPDAQAEEKRQRTICDFRLYVITPRMTGVYSIAEAIDDSNKHLGQTLFCVLEHDEEFGFTKAQFKSLHAVANLIRDNGGHVFESLEQCATFLNNT